MAFGQASWLLHYMHGNGRALHQLELYCIVVPEIPKMGC